MKTYTNIKKGSILYSAYISTITARATELRITEECVTAVREDRIHTMPQNENTWDYKNDKWLKNPNSLYKRSYKINQIPKDMFLTRQAAERSGLRKLKALIKRLNTLVAQTQKSLKK